MTDKARHYTVIREPIITEKAVTPRGPHERDRKGKPTGERKPQYAFWVDPLSNKVEIRQAIETIFGVKVLKVRTSNLHGRTRRVRWKRVPKAPAKKAWVTLKEGTIDFMS
ncbi:MAG: 50S ribosomal protein L23 [Planctomycetota bacterium]